MSLVSFVKIKPNNMKKTIEEALDLIEYKFENSVKNVVIKANLCYYWDYSTGRTTDPKFAGALIDVIREKLSEDVRVSIVESDASAMKCKYAFKFLGYEKLAKDYNVQLVNLSEDTGGVVKTAVNGQTFNFKVPDTIRNADLRINLTTIKYSMEKIKITCALKNIFGCNPFPRKYTLHSRLSEAIVALNKVMKFDLCFVDGNIVYGASTRRLGLLMASQDAVAIDTAAAKIAGVNPRSIPYLGMARAAGLGNTSFVARGTRLEYFRDRYPKKDPREKTDGSSIQLNHYVEFRQANRARVKEERKPENEKNKPGSNWSRIRGQNTPEKQHETSQC